MITMMDADRCCKEMTDDEQPLDCSQCLAIIKLTPEKKEIEILELIFGQI